MPPRAQLAPVHAAGESKDGPWRVWVSAKQSETGKKYRRYFPTKAAAEEFAKQTRARLAEYGDAARHMTGEQRLEWYRCQLICDEHGFGPMEATLAFAEKVKQAKRSVFVPALVDEYLTYKDTRALSPDYLKDSRIVLERFAKAHPDTLASDLTADGIKTFVDGLGLASPVSWNNNRRLISVLLNFAARHDPAFVAVNVCERLEEKPVPPKEVEIYTVEQARALLTAAGAHDRRAVPILAVALFAGIRPDESRRLDWTAALWPEGVGEAGHIEVAAAKSKDGKRRLVEIQPNLLAWLTPFRGTTGKIWPFGRHYYYEVMPAIRRKAGVEGIRDGFRHTFASHHLAKFADPGRTTGDLGHRTTAMLWEHYRSAVPKSAGVAFFEIYP